MRRIYKHLLALFFFLFLLIGSNIYAHSVQVGYCVNCNGDLRIWVEHWHTTENPASTTMNLEINVGGVITPISGIPDTSVTGITVGNLPGCFTPMTTFVTCQGTGIYMPNVHNDWVAYDFNNLPCGVPIEVTVISGNTVFTADCGNPINMYPASSGQFVIPCNTQQLPDIDTCAGNNIGPFAFPATNTWTNSNPAIGLAASGTGDVPMFTAANNATTQTGTITVNNECGVATFDVTVYPAPTSSFVANVGCPGQPVGFTDQSISLGGNITGWTWDFGDGSPVFNGQNPPPYVYPPGGPFNVTLTTTTANGCTHDTIIPVDPLGGLVANFIAPSVCDINGVTPTVFTDGSTPVGNITNWAWDYDGDGITDDIIPSPTFTFPGPGTYNVQLHVTGVGGCQDSITIPVIVNASPIASFTASAVCFPDSNYFIDGSTVPLNTNYQWDFGDGIGISSLSDPAYSYAAPGTYYVTLTLTTDSGCVHTYSDSVSTLSSTIAAFNVGNVCSNAPAVFLDQSTVIGGTISSWQWDFDGDGIIDNTNQNPTYLYPGPGLYNVQLIVSVGGSCPDTIVVPVNVFAVPTADFSFINACLGTGIAYTDLSNPNGGTITNWDWDFDNLNTSVIQNPNEVYTNEGVYNVQLITTTLNGCTDTISKPIEVWPTPFVDFSPNEVCLNALTQFNDLSTVSNVNTINTINQWSWDFGDGIGLSNSQNPFYTYTTPGTYQANLSVVSSNGCTNDTTIDVIVNTLPVVSFSGDNLFGCAPVLVNFTDNTVIGAPSNLASWYWDFGNGMSSTSQNPVGISFENPSTVSVATYGVSLTVVSDKGCIGKDSIINMITSYPIPLAYFSFSPDRTDVYDREISFTDQSLIAVNWNWDLGDGTSSMAQHPVHEYPDSGSYNVVLYIENVYGCKDTARKTVIIDPAFALWIPNSFTPDGDGINDMFFATGFGFTELHTLIFDRWGTLIFEGKSIDSQWSGNYRGSMLQEDVFVYKIKVKDVFNEWHEYIGKVTLIK